jgi:hypothetical protein
MGGGSGPSVRNELVPPGTRTVNAVAVSLCESTHSQIYSMKTACTYTVQDTDASGKPLGIMDGTSWSGVINVPSAPPTK